MEPLPSPAELAAGIPPTPQISWPLLNARVGAELWVKHENHTPLGAFKVRGGLVYFDWLARTQPGRARRDRSHARQSRAIDRVCGAAAQAARRHRRAARQQPRKKPRCARSARS
jgi:threonine dehydratase